MPAYNFQGRFAQMIVDGSKRQTIRPRRKRPTRSGDVLQLYTGMRTKACRLLKVADCTSVVPVMIDPVWSWVEMDGHVLSAADEGMFAQRDGFENADEFYTFFKRYAYDVLFNELEVIYWR